MSHYQYVSQKIAHLKRAGLVAASKEGCGQHGGACPDWLVTAQKDEQKRLLAASLRQRRAGEVQPDIEWFVPALIAAE